MEPYRQQVRKRIIELYDRGKPTRYIAELFGDGRAGVRRVRAGERLTRCPVTPGAAVGLGEAGRGRLAALVTQQPDATPAELRASLGAVVALLTVDRALRRLGLRLKKVAAGGGAGSLGRESPAGRVAGPGGGYGGWGLRVPRRVKGHHAYGTQLHRSYCLPVSGCLAARDDQARGVFQP